MRLVNGTDNSQGKIEVCVDQMWTNVCDKNWSIPDANVVCRQLGYSGNGENDTWRLYYLLLCIFGGARHIATYV